MKSNTRLEIGKWVFHEEGLKIDLGHQFLIGGERGHAMQSI